MNNPMKKQSQFRLPLNLQLFAEEPPADPKPPADPTPPTDPSKNFDDVLKDKTLQSEFDRRLAKSLETARGKWEKDFQKQLEDAKTEAEKLARMTADQKAEHERQKRDKELSDREGEITRRELRATALEQLAEKGLPKTLADILVYTDADTANKSLEAVEKSFREAVEAGVNERLKGNPPGGTGGKGGTEQAGALGKRLATQSKTNEDLAKAQQSYFN